MAGRLEGELMTWSPRPLSKRKSVLFNPYNVLETVKGVDDWWSEGDYLCRGGGLGYWLAVSEQRRQEIEKQYDDPDEQKMKLIECWMTHIFASWQWLSRAVGRVGQTQLAPLISSYDQPTTGMAFTRSNVLGAVRPVKNWWDDDGLGDNLYISKEKRTEIQQVYTDPEEQKRQLILYWMSTDPLASWRRLIRELDDMGQSPVADAIRDFAEPLATDASLTPHNILTITSTVDLDDLNDCLGVPYSVYFQIKDNPSYSIEEERREAMILYFLNNIPLASWATLAGRLYSEEQIEAVRKYLHHTTDSSLSLHNLNTALGTLPPDQLEDFGFDLNIPWSKRQQMESEYRTVGERQSALLQTYLTFHPAPSWQHVATALYQNDLYSVLERVQAMFPSGRYRAKLIYQREMEHGHSETDITKVVMMGIAGSGKSTALDTIMEEEPLAPEDRHSTPIMKRPVKTMVIVVDGKTKWVKKEQHQFTAHLATRINTDPTPPQEATPTSRAHSNTTQSPPTSDSPDSSSHTHSSHRPPLSATGTSTTATQSITAALLQPGPSLSPELSVDALLQSTEVEEEFVSLISQATGSPKPLAHERWVFLIDSGGQTEFQDAFSVFLPHTSICVFVFKLSEPLDSYPVIEYYRNGQLVGRREQSLLTNRDIFEKYMRTMFSFDNRVRRKTEKEVAAIQESSLQPAQPVELPGDGDHSPEPECQDHSSNEDHSPKCGGADECSSEEDSSNGQPPRILLLGTHRDLKHLCERETVEQKNEQLEALIPDKLKKQVIYSADKKPIFEINGLTPDKDDKRMAEAIRECIVHECPSRREKTPWRWHVFNHKMKSIARRMKRNVLSREECLKIAASVGLDKESFQLSLEFFHNLSLIFYYPSILPDVVFVDPQVLLDKVSELVQFTFELKDPSAKDSLLPHGWQQYKNNAQITEKFLENKRFSSHYHETVFTRKHLTTLLERLLVFARLSPDTWFMPCVLKHLKPEEIRPHCVSPSPLVVHFADGGPQHGVCCSLIAHVLSTANRHPCPWSVRHAHNSPACLYRNCIQFQVSDYNGFVMLIDRYTYFEVHIRTSRSKLVEVWRHVRCAVFSGLESVSTTLGYSNNKPSPAILCPGHTTANNSHPAYIRNREWTCSLDCNEFDSVASLKKEHIPCWLEESEYIEDEKNDREPHTMSKRKGEERTDPKETTETTDAHRKESSSTAECSVPQDGSLGEDDLVEITDQLMDLDQSDIYNLGLVLGLAHRRVVDLRENSRSNLAFLDAVVLHWLQRDDRVKEVSWAALVKALLHQRLGHTGIATSIAEKYGVKDCL